MLISGWSSDVCSSDLAAPRKDSFYLGKIAVRPGLQGRGLARRMIALAEAGARSRNLKSLDLQTGIELTENHRAFVAIGLGRKNVVEGKGGCVRFDLGGVALN